MYLERLEHQLNARYGQPGMEKAAANIGRNLGRLLTKARRMVTGRQTASLGANPAVKQIGDVAKADPAAVIRGSRMSQLADGLTPVDPAKAPIQFPAAVLRRNYPQSFTGAQPVRQFQYPARPVAGNPPKPTRANLEELMRDATDNTANSKPVGMPLQTLKRNYGKPKVKEEMGKPD